MCRLEKEYSFLYHSPEQKEKQEINTYIFTFTYGSLHRVRKSKKKSDFKQELESMI